MLNHKSNYITISVVMYLYTYTLKTKWRINPILCWFQLNLSMKLNIYFTSQLLLNSSILTVKDPGLFISRTKTQRLRALADVLEFIMTSVSQNHCRVQNIYFYIYQIMKD